METKSALIVYSNSAGLIGITYLFLHFIRQSELYSQIQTGVLWGCVTTKMIGMGLTVTKAAGPTTTNRGPTQSLQFPRLLSFHSNQSLAL